MYPKYKNMLRLVDINTTTTTTKPLSQVFGVGYMNQKRITPDQAHGSAFSTHSYQAIRNTCLVDINVAIDQRILDMHMNYVI